MACEKERNAYLEGAKEMGDLHAEWRQADQAVIEYAADLWDSLGEVWQSVSTEVLLGAVGTMAEAVDAVALATSFADGYSKAHTVGAIQKASDLFSQSEINRRRDEANNLLDKMKDKEAKNEDLLNSWCNCLAQEGK